jgi:hypothetical protein
LIFSESNDAACIFSSSSFSSSSNVNDSSECVCSNNSLPATTLVQQQS